MKKEKDQLKEIKKELSKKAECIKYYHCKDCGYISFSNEVGKCPICDQEVHVDFYWQKT